MSKIVSPYKNIKQHTRISLEPYHMNSDIRNNMKLVLKKKVEKKCNKNGFIDEVFKILEFSDGLLIPENLNSAAIYNITYHCRICIPIENTTIIAYIKLISTDLIVAINGPLFIFIPKNYVDNTVRSRNLALSLDISDGISNAGIAALLEQIAPVAEYNNGTIARILCSFLVNGTTNLDINPLLSTSSTEFVTPTGTAFGLNNVSFATATIAAPGLVVSRTVKTFQIITGVWLFVS